MALLLPLTGIDQLDRQHMTLVKLIDQLFVLIKKEDYDKEMLDVLSQLFEFTADHFSTEEGYLKMAGYPRIEEHIEEHRFFENELKGWVQNFLMETLDVADLHEKLMDWFKNHISGSDMDYVAFMQKEK